MQFDFTAKSERDTDQLGAALAEVLPANTTLALIGTLGAGKTRLVQALAAACGTPRETVVSPTFVLCQEYRGRRDLFHFDTYRLRDEDEFLQLGPEEYFAAGGITVVEWADRVIDSLPRERLEVRIEVTGETSRSFCLMAVGEPLERAVETLRRQFENPVR